MQSFCVLLLQTEMSFFKARRPSPRLRLALKTNVDPAVLLLPPFHLRGKRYNTRRVYVCVCTERGVLGETYF